MTDVLTTFRVKEAERSVRRECAELVYNYPGFTLEDAFEMPIGDRNLLLAYARLHRAEEMLQLASIYGSAQSAAGFKKITNGLKSSIKELTRQL